MKQTITLSTFRDAFNSMNRNTNFSYRGLGVLYEYLLDLEDQGERELELDVIEICCDYRQEEVEVLLKEYGLETIEDLEEKTTIIDVNPGEVIIYNF